MRITGRAAVLGAGLSVFAGSALLLVLTGHTGVRYSADHDGTVPLWSRSVPALVGVALVLLTPAARPEPARPGPAGVRVQAWLLAGAALAFAVVLHLMPGETAYLVAKLALLAALPAVLLRRSRWSPTPPDARWAPVAPVAGWLLVSYATPLAPPAVDDPAADGVLVLLAALVVGFLANALLEELFYRRWLQARWEVLVGPWAAIVLSSLLWAVWHTAIQGRGDLLVDLASAVLNQGVTGVFLGLLWARYRRLWPLLVVHGAVNALPLLPGLL